MRVRRARLALDLDESACRERAYRVERVERKGRVR